MQDKINVISVGNKEYFYRRVKESKCWEWWYGSARKNPDGSPVSREKTSGTAASRDLCLIAIGAFHYINEWDGEMDPLDG